MLTLAYLITRKSEQLLKRVMDMEYVFKEHYKVFLTSLLYEITNNTMDEDWINQVDNLNELWSHVDWKFQVDHLHELWSHASDMIDRDRAEFWLAFTKECCEMNLPFKDYKIEEAFEKARKEWKDELMLQYADMILKTYDDDIPEKAKVVTIVDGRIQVDTSICRLYASYDIED